MKKFYTYNEQTKRLIEASRIVPELSIVLGDPDDFAKYKNAYVIAENDDPPNAPEGKIVVQDGWELINKEWHKKWKYEDEPSPPPRIFSKLKVVAALMNAGVWPQVKAYIEQAGLYDLYLAAQEFADDNEYFTQGKAQLQTALGWSDAQVERILAASIKD